LDRWLRFELLPSYLLLFHCCFLLWLKLDLRHPTLRGGPSLLLLLLMMMMMMTTGSRFFQLLHLCYPLLCRTLCR
jgi:hypothetical protein